MYSMTVSRDGLGTCIIIYVLYSGKFLRVLYDNVTVKADHRRKM